MTRFVSITECETGHDCGVRAKLSLVLFVFGSSLSVLIATASAQDQRVGDLAAAAQNPIADMVSLPHQKNTFFSLFR